MKTGFFDDGFAVYDNDPLIARWAAAVRPFAEAALQDQANLDRWLVCQGTWFVGVDALETGPNGEAGSTPLRGQVIGDLKQRYPVKQPMHKAQLSVVYPGYPKPRDGESEAAFRYRERRDAAHVDGLHATGVNRRRHLVEHHAYLLGIPITRASSQASPLVVWKGSHKVVQSWLADQFAGLAESDWAGVDLTDSYLSIRRKIFESCPRVEVPVQPGQAVIMHRHALHGIAPWGATACAESERRMIAYFRPEMAGSLTDWLQLP